MLNNLEKWTTLHDNITSRFNALDEDTILKHHVSQFRNFCEKAETCLRDSRNESETEVIELLAAHWKRFDNVASQYLKSSRYSSSVQNLEEFNKRACGYYYRLCRALPEEITNRVSLSAPLFYFEDPSADLGELTLFRGEFPALLSVPESNQGEPVVAYEVARAFFEQLPGFVPELKSRIQSQLPDLPERIIDWLGDIAAKLTSIALLFDLGELKKHLLIPAKPDMAQTEIAHPVVLILPYIGLEALQHFLDHFLGDEKLGDRKSNDVIAQIKKDLDEFLGDRLTRQWEFIPALTKVSLQEVKDTMLNVIRSLLSDEMTLKALGGRSLFEVLIACADDKPENTEAVLLDWGIISDEACQQFAMELPNLLRPACAAPLPFSCRSVLSMSPTRMEMLSFSWLDVLKSIFG